MKTVILKLKKAAGLFTLILAILAILQGCRHQKYKEQTTTDVLMTSYLTSNPDTFGMFLKLLDTTKYAGFLATWGNNTCFAPTNLAFKNYFSSQGQNLFCRFFDGRVNRLGKIPCNTRYAAHQ